MVSAFCGISTIVEVPQHSETFLLCARCHTGRADGTCLRHRSLPGLGRQTVVDRHFRCSDGEPPDSGTFTMWEPRHTRKPMLLLRLSGLLLLRLAARQLFGLLLQEPPRNTRDRSQAAPQAGVCKISVDQSYKGSKKTRGRRYAPPSGQRLSDSAPSVAASRGSMGEPRHTRKPMKK